MEPSQQIAATFFASLGVGGVLAWGMFSVYRKDVKQMLEAWQGQTALLMKVVTENTQALSEHKAAIERALTEIRTLMNAIVLAQKEGQK